MYPLASYTPEWGRIYGRRSVYETKKIDTRIIEPQITYKKSFGNGMLDCLIGATINQNSSIGETLEGTGYNSDLVLENIRSAGWIGVIASFANEYKYAALF